MIWNKMNEPVRFGTEDLRVILQDYATTTARLLEALHTTVKKEESLHWRPHLPQIHAALARFGELCREELENLGGWREDGRDPEEVHEFIWEEGERLVRWLNRMLGVT